MRQFLKVEKILAASERVSSCRLFFPGSMFFHNKQDPEKNRKAFTLRPSEQGPNPLTLSCRRQKLLSGGRGTGNQEAGGSGEEVRSVLLLQQRPGDKPGPQTPQPGNSVGCRFRPTGRKWPKGSR